MLRSEESVTSEITCRELCLQEDENVCVGFQMNEGKCQLMKSPDYQNVTGEYLCKRTGRSLVILKKNAFSMHTGKLDVKFMYQTTYSWHSLLKWKYDEGYLINLALNLALTHDSKTLGLAEKSIDTKKWGLDYKGNIILI